tara:strand:- start:1486 stop:2571 length:1086 start_codon:yes stop_codon:yes gene_type:complete
MPIKLNTKRKVSDHYSRFNYEVLDNLRTGILILDHDLDYIFSNSAAYAILGVSNNLPKITNLECEDLELELYLKKVLIDDQSIILRDLKFKNFDSSERIVDCNISTYYVNKLKYILVELNETARLYNISMDKSLIEQQKATREMVKGLSHEIKNPLGGIMGAAQLIDKNLKDKSLIKFTKIITKESERLLKMINSLTSASTSSDQEHLYIHEITDHVIDLFRYDKTENITFKKDYDPSIPEIFIARNQIVQALINIVKNAIQAIDTAGTITLKTRTMLKYTIGDIKYDLVVRIDCIDNGVGIPEEKLKEIFFPMVTTKNEGMGLGLTIAQSLITQNKGLIECQSKQGKTVFSVIIPWSQKK